MAGETDTIQNQRLDKVETKVETLQTKVGEMETANARLDQKVESLHEKVGSGFLDLKAVIVARSEKDEADRARQHELQLQESKDKQVLWGKILGIITTIVGIAAAGGGGAYYTMKDAPEASERRPAATEPAPEAVAP